MNRIRPTRTSHRWTTTALVTLLLVTGGWLGAVPTAEAVVLRENGRIAFARFKGDPT